MIKTLLSSALLACAAIFFPAYAQDSESNAASPTYNGEDLGASFNPNRPVWQQTSSAGDTDPDDGITEKFLTNRRALVGEGCHINRLSTTVGVANADVKLANLIDEDISNNSVLAYGVGADVAVNQLVSVRDTKNYYAKGTSAGFCIVGSQGNDVLSLDLVKLFAIYFYRDGVLVGTTTADEGQTGGGLDLSVINLSTSGSSASSLFVAGIAPATFDEVELVINGGVNLSVAGNISIKYAFAGNSADYKITRDWTEKDVNHVGGITHYNTDYNRNIALKKEKDVVKEYDAAKVNSSYVDKVLGYNKFIEDPDDGKDIGPVFTAAISNTGTASFLMTDKDDADAEVYPAGTEVGFNVTSASALKLGLGNGTKITLLDKDGNETESFNINAGVLELGVADASNAPLFVSSTKPFSGAKLTYVDAAVGVNVGGSTIDYALIRLTPEIPHVCPLNIPTQVYLQPGTTSYKIAYNHAVDPVKFELLSSPEGVENATVDSNGVLSGIDKTHPGEYLVKVSVNDADHTNCYETVSIRNDQFQGSDNETAGGCGEPVVNDSADNAEDTPVYSLSDTIYETSGSLLSVSDLKDPQNIIDSDCDNYADFISGLKLGSDLMIIGVKSNKEIGDSAEARRIGFVVEENTNGLNAKVLQFFQIRCYNDGVKVESSVIEESNFIAADVIGTGKVTKVRYSVVVPAGVQFNEFQLWTSGVADVDISKLRIYYPFIEEENSTCQSLLGCDGRLLNRHAYIVPTKGEGVSVGGTINNLSHLVDEDMESYMEINGVNVGQAAIVRVGLGEVVHPTHQVGIITSNETYLANVGVGQWLTVKTYQSSAMRNSGSESAIARAESTDDSDLTPTGDQFSNWNVADANVAGFGNKNALYFTPTKPFDTMELQVNGVANVLNGQKFYGICTRGDSDGDGIPDCMDQEYTEIFTSVGKVIESISDLSVSVRGDKALVRSSLGLGRVMVFDINGSLLDFVHAEGLQEAAITLQRGINLIRIEEVGSKAKTLKIVF